MSDGDGQTRIRGLFGSSALYALSNLLQRGLTFLLLPLYARSFTTAEFGAMDMLYQIVLILSLVTSFGLPQGLVRGLYLEGDTTERQKRRLLGALSVFLFPFTILVGLLLAAASHPISDILFSGQGNPVWIQLSAAFYVALAFQQLPLQLLKTTRQAGKYALWSLLSFAVVAACNVVFIVVLHWGLSGMILANLAGIGGTGLYLFWDYLKLVEWNVQFRLLAPLFAFGLPMLPALLARKVLEVADRYMIPHYHGMEELGIYVMGAKVAAILDALLLVPFLYAWQPFFYSLAERPDAGKVFARVTHYIFLLLCLIFLCLDASRVELLRFLGGAKFASAQSVVDLLVLGVLFNGLQYCVSPGIHLRKKLPQEMGVMFASAAVNMILNLLLIPPYKGLGAAEATAAAYLFYLVGTFWLSQNHYPVAYPWGRLLNASLQTGMAWIGLHLVEGLAAKSSIVAVYSCSCLGADLWLHGELGQILRWRSSRARSHRP